MSSLAKKRAEKNKEKTSVVDEINAQVLPQIQHLAQGPLAVAAAEVIGAAVAQKQGISANVLQARVRIDGHLYTLVVQVVATP